jgi:hypothetical protein
MNHADDPTPLSSYAWGLTKEQDRDPDGRFASGGGGGSGHDGVEHILIKDVGRLRAGTRIAVTGGMLGNLTGTVLDGKDKGKKAMVPETHAIPTLGDGDSRRSERTVTDGLKGKSVDAAHGALEGAGYHKSSMDEHSGNNTVRYYMHSDTGKELSMTHDGSKVTNVTHL